MNSNHEQEQGHKDKKHCCHGHGRHRCWKFPFIIAAVILIKSAVVMVLWNLLVPELFQGPQLSYLHAIELSVLVKLLVGFGGHRNCGRHGGHHHWMKGHFGHLSAEDREKLREGIKKHCGE